MIETQLYEDRVVTNGERERRVKRRFHITEDVRYRTLYGQCIAEPGTGRTVNISSGGVAFTTEARLSAGMPIEISMTWPVLLNDSCPMKLMIYGCVVRSNDKSAAVAIERFEFRTQGRSLQAPPAVVPAAEPYRVYA